MERTTSISRGTGKSLHGQVRSRLYADIASGAYAPGAQLPTEKEIAEQYGVSLAPVRAALGQLAQSGLIERTQGRGTFVLEPKVQYSLRLLSSCTESLRLAKVDFDVRVVDCGLRLPPQEVAQALNLRRTTRAFHLRRVMALRGRPAILIESWLASHVADVVDDRSFFESGGSLYARLRSRDISLNHSSGRLDVVFCNQEEAELLEMPFATPLLGLASMSFADERAPIEWSRSLYDPSRFSLTLERNTGKMSGE